MFFTRFHKFVLVNPPAKTDQVGNMILFLFQRFCHNGKCFLSISFLISPEENNLFFYLKNLNKMCP